MAYDKFWDEIVSERTLIKGYFRQGHAEGRAEGLAEGLAEGEKKGRYEVARNLLAMHLPIDSIIKATGLSKEDIDQLI